MKPYSVRVTVRNNLILQAIADFGYQSQAAFARFAGMNEVTLNSLVAMRLAPITRKGKFSDAAMLLMEVLGACPSDLWTDEQLVMSLPRNSAEFTANANELAALSHGDLPIEEQRVFIRQVWDGIGAAKLTKDELLVLSMRFSDEESTLAETAAVVDLSRERVRQLEAVALRKLRKRLRPKLENMSVAGRQATLRKASEQLR